MTSEKRGAAASRLALALALVAGGCTKAHPSTSEPGAAQSSTTAAPRVGSARPSRPARTPMLVAPSSSVTFKVIVVDPTSGGTRASAFLDGIRARFAGPDESSSIEEVPVAADRDELDVRRLTLHLHQQLRGHALVWNLFAVGGSLEGLPEDAARLFVDASGVVYLAAPQRTTKEALEDEKRIGRVLGAGLVLGHDVCFVRQGPAMPSPFDGFDHPRVDASSSAVSALKVTMRAVLQGASERGCGVDEQDAGPGQQD